MAEQAEQAERIGKDEHGNGMRTTSHLLLEDSEETARWEKVSPRKVPEDQWRRFEGYVGEIFEAFGMDLSTAGTVRTPDRFLRALFESTAGYEGDPKLLTAFPKSRSSRCASTTPCRSSGRRTWGTSRTRRSSGSRS